MAGRVEALAIGRIEPLVGDDRIREGVAEAEAGRVKTAKTADHLADVAVDVVVVDGRHLRVEALGEHNRVGLEQRLWTEAGAQPLSEVMEAAGRAASPRLSSARRSASLLARTFFCIGTAAWGISS